MRHYPFHPGDFNSATRHLTKLERWFYRDLIDMYHDTEEPIIGDFDLLCRKLMAQSEEERTSVEQVLKEFFFLVDNVYKHARCQQEVDTYHGQIQAKSAAGKKSAEVKAKKKALKAAQSGASKQASTGVEQESTELEQTSAGVDNHKPRTKNQEPSKSKEDYEKFIGDLFDDFWSSGINKTGKKNASKVFCKLAKEAHKGTQMTKEEAAKEFTMFLIRDIQERLNNEQFGFDQLHPTTYLNGERWNDEHKPKNPANNTSKRTSASEQVREAIDQENAAEGNHGVVGSSH